MIVPLLQIAPRDTKPMDLAAAVLRVLPGRFVRHKAMRTDVSHVMRQRNQMSTR
eukprot:SAG31_NODE_37757_length_301_cov_1.534653_1_plen_53_part_01